MQISERAVGDVVLLDVKGRITLGDGDEMLKDKVNAVVNAGKKKIMTPAEPRLSRSIVGVADQLDLPKMR